MPQSRVWRPDDTEPNKQKQKKSKKQSKHMANDFWDKLIQSDKTVSICFIDDIKLQAKILSRDKYYITVEADDEELMIFKHSIKWVEES